MLRNNNQRCLFAAYSAFSTAIIMKTTPVGVTNFFEKIKEQKTFENMKLKNYGKIFGNAFLRHRVDDTGLVKRTV